MDGNSSVQTLIALLRGESGAAELVRACEPAALFASARREGVASLVLESMARMGNLEAASDEFEPFARGEAVADVASDRALRRVLSALSAAGVPAVIFKGEHLAHVAYARPDLRPRTDTDVLVAAADRDRASRALEDCGFRAAPRLDAGLISYQAAFLPGEGAAGRPIDLHWRLTNPQAFAGILTTQEIQEGAIALPALGEHARVPSLVHALVIALVHRVSHHAGVSRLIWDLDVAKIATLMTGNDWAEFVSLARRRAASRLFAGELARAVWFDSTAVPCEVLNQLRGQSERENAHHHREQPTRAGELLANIRAIDGWRERAALLGQHVLPSPAYMRNVYAPSSRAPLPVLYLRRALLGAWKYCRPTAG